MGDRLRWSKIQIIRGFRRRAARLWDKSNIQIVSGWDSSRNPSIHAFKNLGKSSRELIKRNPQVDVS